MSKAAARALQPPRIAPAGASTLDDVRALFRDYEAAFAGGAAQCFADFEDELAALPGDCALPLGGILLARDGHGKPVGVVAFRQLEPGVAEMKRLYVRPEQRGRGLGRRLVEAVLREAAARGYGAVRLSTVPAAMRAADALYQTTGFRPIASYPGAACGAQCYETAL